MPSWIFKLASKAIAHPQFFLQANPAVLLVLGAVGVYEIYNLKK